MKNAQVLEFMNALSRDTSLNFMDQRLCQTIKQRFEFSEKNALINSQDAEFLLSLFNERWQHIFDTRSDYTFQMTLVHQIWFDFAKILGFFLKIPPLQILMPSIEESTTPDNFLRLSDIKSPHDLYLSNNGKTWRSVDFLLTFDGKKQPKFSLFDFPNLTKRRLWSLKELYRLKHKTGKATATISKEIHQFDSVWDFIYKIIRPVWSQKGSFPEPFIQDLVELIECYSDNDDGEAFKEQLDFLNLSLTKMPYQEVAQIFATPLTNHKEPVYLYEALVSCYEGQIKTKHALCQIAKWMYSKNPAIVCKNTLLMSMYHHVNIGPFYGFEQMRNQINLLSAETHEALKELLFSLQFKCNQKNIGIEDVFGDIQKLYKKRWLLIGDTQEDYFAMPGGVNEPWIYFAQTLQGAGLIKGTFYQLLVPSICHSDIPILDINVSLFSPDNYILSHDGQRLIYLKNCEKHLKIKGSFMHYISMDQAIPLTEPEMKRLLRAKPEYRQYADMLSQVHLISTPISKKTVEMIRQLVIATLYTKGWRLGHEYEENELNDAETAYLYFAEYLHKLSLKSPVEYRNLMAHRISYENNLMTFSEVVSKIQNPKNRECVAVYTKYLMKLVINYNKDAIFSKDIESRHTILSDMRLRSANLIYLDYAQYPFHEIQRRSFLMMVGLLVHPFRVTFGTGHDIEFSGFNNTVTNTGKKIFDLLLPLLQDAREKTLRGAYQRIMEEIIPSSLNKMDFSWSKSMVRSSDTQLWFQKLLDGSYFSKENIYYSPRRIFNHCVIFLRKQKIELNYLTKVHEYMERYLLNCVQKKHPLNNWLLSNKFYTDILKPAYPIPFISSMEPMIQLDLCYTVFDYLTLRFDFMFQCIQKQQIVLIESKSKTVTTSGFFKAFDLKEGETLPNMLQRLILFIQTCKTINPFVAKNMLLLVQRFTKHEIESEALSYL